MFVTWSQTIGRLVIAPGAVILITWLMFRNGLESQGRWHQRRPAVIGLGLTLVAAGWIVFFALDGDLGLLLVVLGAIVISATALDVQRDPAGGPIDGPWYGDTNG